MGTDWTVWRLGGRGGWEWRQVYAGDEATAREKYEAELWDLKHGGASLCGPDGKGETTWWSGLGTRW